ncbi:hypothetical protein ANCDUO_20211, partial [Ancylostoma duodenale]
MTNRLDRVDFVLNPDTRYFAQIMHKVGVYYVREEWRGSGVGSVLFEKIMDIGKGSNKALHGALKMSAKYASKYGFDKMPNYIHEFASIPIENLIIPDGDSRYILKDLKDVDENKLVAYDAAICQRRRAKYLHNFITTANCNVKDVARSLLAGVLPMIQDIKNYKSFASLYPPTNKEAH